MNFEPTPEQARAIGSLGGDLFISAGAGSGKTAVLARRFAETVARGAAPDAVLAITFTRKAAAELGERVRRVLRAEAGDPGSALAMQAAWISTIHGFCSRVLRRHPVEARLAPGFRVADEADAGLLREEAFERSSALRERDPDVAALIARVGAAKARSLVLALHARLRSMGLPATALPALRVPDLRAVLGETMSALGASLDEHPDEPANKTQARNTAALRSAIGALGANAAALDGDALAAAVLAAVADCALKKNCRATAGAVDSAREALAMLVDAAQTIQMRRYAGGLTRLLEAFAGEYAGAKTERGVLDQDDLQEAAERLFRERPEIAAEYARRFAAIMVDEFQDTNELQMRVLQPLRRDDLCVVGDERQAIYSFRNADVEVFRRVRDGIGATVPLDVNFRSHPEILAFVNAVFGAAELFGEGHAVLRPGRAQPAGPAQDGTVVAASPGEPRAEVLLVERDGWEGLTWREAEARMLARRIAELVAGGVAPGEVVILMRALTGCAPYAAALEAEGLPASVTAGGSFGARPEVVEVEALLAVAALPSDSEALATVLLGDLADVSAAGLLALRDSAEEIGSMWGALEAAASEGHADLERRDRVRTAAVVEAVGALREHSHRRGLGEALVLACRTLGVRENLLRRGPEGERALGNVRKLVRMAEAFGRDRTSDPGAFVEHLRAQRAYGRAGQAPASTAESVRLMTVHSAKGLEFPVVAVADLGRDVHRPDDPVFVEAVAGESEPRWSLALPASRTGEPELKPLAYRQMRDARLERSLAEEKRLLYVACTRAEERLLLSGATTLDACERDSRPVAWVRAALGLAEAVGETGTRTCGDARISLRAARPGDLAHAGPPSRESNEGDREPMRSGPLGEAAAASVAEGRQASDTAPAEVARQARDAALLVEGSGDLSYTALHLFSRCAYRFYAERVVGIRANASRPTSLAFGSAVHAALQAASAGSPSESRLAAIASAHGLPPASVPRLARAIETFAGSPLADRVRAAEHRAHEVPFAIPLAGHLLSGAMDLVARRGGSALVVDYKTGTAQPPGRPSRGASADEHRDSVYRLQAECYALALLQSGCEAVEVAFVELEREAAVTSMHFGPGQAAALRERLENLASAARTGPFPRCLRYEPSVCADCPVLGGLCGISAPPRKTRGAA